MRALTALILLILSAGISRAELSESAKAEIEAMHWFQAPGYPLRDSKSSIGNLKGFQLLAGVEGRRFRDLVDGRSDPQQEADVFNLQTNSELVYEWFPLGYVTSVDWSDVDADALLSQMRAADAEANKIRLSKGLTTFTTQGWRSKPNLNRDTNTVSWSITGVDDKGGTLINSVALKLGRYGFEKIVWVYDSSLIGDKDDLLFATNNHLFDAGSRYSDDVASTDRSAEYGVAGLVAGALGVKLVQGAGIGAALIGMKKLAFLLIFPIIFLWKKFIGLFKRKGGPIR